MAKCQGEVLIGFSDKSVKVSRKTLDALVRFVLAAEGMKPGRIDLAIVGEREIAASNRQYLNHAGSTDVISFDLSDCLTPGLTAQIIVCAPMATRQAKYHGLTARQELMLYIIHGLLHVTGYDDLSVRQHAKMAARQDELLKEFLGKGKAGKKKTPAKKA
jgi:probable rRNA maturation factor